jgi:hypothetical protein
MAHEIPRPRNSTLCHMAASASLRSLRWQRIHALHCWRPARAARVCAPSMACRFGQCVAVARGVVIAAPVGFLPRAGAPRLLASAAAQLLRSSSGPRGQAIAVRDIESPHPNHLESLLAVVVAA